MNKRHSKDFISLLNIQHRMKYIIQLSVMSIRKKQHKKRENHQIFLKSCIDKRAQFRFVQFSGYIMFLLSIIRGQGQPLKIYKYIFIYL